MSCKCTVCNNNELARMFQCVGLLNFWLTTTFLNRKQADDMFMLARVIILILIFWIFQIHGDEFDLWEKQFEDLI